MSNLKNIAIYYLVCITCISFTEAQQQQRPLPKFTLDTLRQANSLVLYDNTPLNACNVLKKTKQIWSNTKRA